MEFKHNERRKTFQFQPAISIEESWMIGGTVLEVYDSIFIITEEIDKFELYTQPLEDEFSYTQFKDNIAEILGLSNISREDLQHEIHGPDIIKTYRKLSVEKGQTDVYHILLIRYSLSPFRNFESYLRILTGLNEDDNQL